MAHIEINPAIAMLEICDLRERLLVSESRAADIELENQRLKALVLSLEEEHVQHDAMTGA